MADLGIVKDPAKTALGQRQQLDEVANAPDDKLKKLSPNDVRALASKGADLAGDAADAQSKTDDEKSSLKIKIHLDIDVEVHLTARIKGDIVIGLL